jgi:hypothetical protein
MGSYSVLGETWCRGGCWMTNIQTTATMIEFAERWAGFRCTSQRYRRRLLTHFIRRPQIDDGRDDDKIIDAQMAAHDLGQGHGLRITNLKYGLTSNVL